MSDINVSDPPRANLDAPEEAPACLLVIDVGNTNVVLGVFEETSLIQHWRLQTRRQETADELGITLLQLMAAVGMPPSRIRHGIVSSVVPPMANRFQEMAQRYLGISLLVVGPGIRTGMPILYENPREVGADRIVNAVAAYEKYHSGLIVVDFGTATTFDAVSPQGEYLGGAIAPGITIASDALFSTAAMLPRVDIVRPSRVVGRNTVASMQSGILFGYSGLVSEIVRRMKQELRFPVRVLATGGLAQMVAKETEVIEEVAEHLTLDGLRLIFERNRETGP